MFDLTVVGGGSGGVRAARIAAGYGARVALVERYRLGGTCVIRGCVPKKLMVYASRFAQEFEEAAGYGWALGPVSFDWPTLKANRDREIGRLEEIYRGLLERSGVEVVHGDARLLDPHTVAVGDKQYQSRHILIATGSHPVTPPDIPGREHILNSNDFFEMEQLPASILIQGAGYIAMELGCVLQRLGSRVNIVFRGDQVLRGFDQDVQQHLTRELRASGLELQPGLTVRAIEPQATTGFKVTLSDGSTLHVEKILQALGREPSTAGLGLEELGVSLTPTGAVAVNDYSQTNIDSIWAVGDVTNRVTLTPAAIREGHAFADHVFGGMDKPIRHGLIPTAVFTTPEIGTVGLTELQALQNHPELDVYRTDFKPIKATLSGHTGRVMFKLLVDRSTDRVVGFHAVGGDAGELAQLVGVAMQMGARKQDFDATLAIHPTAAEELVTLRTAAQRHNFS
jgi:glutathione reductase (NADPH)